MTRGEESGDVRGFGGSRIRDGEVREIIVGK